MQVPHYLSLNTTRRGCSCRPSWPHPRPFPSPPRRRTSFQPQVWRQILLVSAFVQKLGAVSAESAPSPLLPLGHRLPWVAHLRVVLSGIARATETLVLRTVQTPRRARGRGWSQPVRRDLLILAVKSKCPVLKKQLWGPPRLPGSQNPNKADTLSEATAAKWASCPLSLLVGEAGLCPGQGGSVPCS